MSNFSPNFWANRNHNGKQGKPEIIVLHRTSGSFSSARGWLGNPASKASANKLIGKDGTVLTLVRDEDAAWANGLDNDDVPTNPIAKELKSKGINVNLHSLSIEAEWLDGDGIIEVGSAIYKAHIQTCAEWCIKYNIPIDRTHIVGHFEVDPIDKPFCGKHIPWPYIIADIKKTVAAITTKPEEVLEPWAKEAQEYVIKNKISDGSRPNDPVTRKELWRMIMNMREGK